MIANPNPNLPKRLQWYIVLAALTCVSASPSTVEPKTIYAGSAALKQPLGVVGQSDARVKRYLRRNSDATESMDEENEDRGGNLGFTIKPGLAEAIDLVDTVNPVVSAINKGLAAKVGEAGKSDVIFGVSGKNLYSTAKDGGSSIQDVINQEFKSVMGKNLELYKNEENDVRANMFKSEEFTKWNNEVNARFSGQYLDVVSQSKVATLLSIFGKDDLIKMLAAAERDPTTKAIADHLEMGLLGKWMKAGDSILAAAKADGTNESIWRNLLHLQEKRQRLKQEYPQAEEWLMDGKRVDDVFNDLKLQHKGEDMLGTKDWNAWVSYVTFLEEQKQVKDQREIAMVIYSVLESKLSSQDLTNLVATAKTVEETQEIAKKWEWRIAKRTSDDVFDLLKLKEKGDAVFETPEFKSWMFYVKELKSASKHTYDAELAYRLYGHYGLKVERMLEQSEKTASAKNDEDTKLIVGMLLDVIKR
ncbi:unnamed protein product [Peronospora effusa]|nr:unnamed protein product [Peronospora effusa]